MNIRRWYTVVAGLAVLFMLASACKKPGVIVEKGEEKTAAPAPVTETPMPTEAPAVQPQRPVDDTGVEARWKALEFTVTEKKEGGASVTVTIDIHGEAEVPGTPLKIAVVGFLPEFAMGPESITTKSLDDVNPAARIQVFDGEESLFEGWAFRDFPAMHSFDDPRYSLQFTRAIPVEKTEAAAE